MPGSEPPESSPPPAARRSGRDRQPSRRVLENADIASTSTATKRRAPEGDDDNDAATDTESAGPPPLATISTSSMSKLERFETRFKTNKRTPEEVLNAQRKTWTSSVYKHFVDPPKIKVESTKISYLFQCGLYVFPFDICIIAQVSCLSSHPSIVIARARTDESTSNLNRHVKACAPVSSAQSKALASYVHGHGYSHARHRVGLALWCARRARPYAAVEDPELVMLFKDCYAGVEMPSRVTVSRDVQEIHRITKEHLKRELVVRLLSFPSLLRAYKLFRRSQGRFTSALTVGLPRMSSPSSAPPSITCRTESSSLRYWISSSELFHFAYLHVLTSLEVDESSYRRVSRRTTRRMPARMGSRRQDHGLRRGQRLQQRHPHSRVARAGPILPRSSTSGPVLRAHSQLGCWSELSLLIHRAFL